MCLSLQSAFNGIDHQLRTLNIPADERAAIIADVRTKAEARRLAEVDSDAANAELARSIHRTRLMGNELIGGRVMCDPGFEMLLDLFVADHGGERRTVGDLCVSARAPQTTGLRHIEKLERDGFLRRAPDACDRRRWWVDPTARTIAGVSAYLNELRRKP